MKSLTLGTSVVSKMSKPYIIAEIGVNHGGKLDLAKQMILLAKEGGANAVKFQTYKAGLIAAKNSPYYWDLSKEPTKNQYELFKKYDNFDKRDYYELAKYCEKIKIDFISTPFDENAVEFLNPIMPFYKVASADILNLPLLRQIAKMNKPIVLSTGASTIEEIKVALIELEKHGARDIVLLHCILCYPTSYTDANLNMICDLQEKFPNYIIGYSDHTIPSDNMDVLIAAYLKGAVVIEKHFTYDKTLKGNDHFHSMDVNNLKTFREKSDFYHSLFGLNIKKPIKNENLARQNARRSVVLSKDIKRDDVIDETMILPKRPGTGITTLDWDKVIGCRAKSDMSEDHILEWEDLDCNYD